jgi:hypothetical protein
LGIGRSALNAVPWNTAGRKPAPQLLAPDCGTPRGSGMATNAGRSSVSLPSAYDTQAPALGNPSSVKPVLIWFSAGPCVLLRAVIEWMKHISSTSLARCGSNCETCLPVSPRGRNCHGLRVSAPCSPWNVISLSPPGNASPWRRISSGL